MKCYLCNSDSWQTRNGSVRDMPELSVLECRTCGLVTLSSTEHIDQGHYENSGMHSGKLPSIENWLQSVEIDDQRRFDMLNGALQGKKLLDFGCGAGGFLQKARITTIEAAGIEPEKRVRDYWKSKIKIYESLDDVDEKYDFITAFHVVEHLIDPCSTLNALASHLTVGGRLVIEVPSAEDALLTLYDNKSFQNFTYWSQHLYLFNASTLARLATQSGLTVVALQQHQRYPLSNHLYWLSHGVGGGHQKWMFLDSPDLKLAYANALAAIGKCDTLIAHLEKKE